MAVLPQRILFNGLSQFECVEFTKKKRNFLYKMPFSQDQTQKSKIYDTKINISQTHFIWGPFSVLHKCRNPVRNIASYAFPVFSYSKSLVLLPLTGPRAVCVGGLSEKTICVISSCTHPQQSSPRFKDLQLFVSVNTRVIFCDSAPIRFQGSIFTTFFRFFSISVFHHLKHRASIWRTHAISSWQ